MMANFQHVSQALLKHVPQSFSDSWKDVLLRPGTYAIFDERRWEVIVPNNEVATEKGTQARLIGMWGGQDGGARLDVRLTKPTPGLTVELVSEKPVAPHLWLWCLTANLPQCLVKPVRTSIIGVTTVADARRPAGSAWAAELPVIVTPQGAFSGKLPNWSGGSREQTRDAIMDECERQGVTLDTQVAYLLATCQHECGFRPIREGQFGGNPAAKSEPFRRNLSYYPYFGRGYVQLTHKGNYQFYQDLLGVELVADPDLALEPDVALFVLVHGVMTGKFGQALTRFVNARLTDFVNARRSVNKLDRAEDIAAIARRWLAWLHANQPDRFAHGSEPSQAGASAGLRVHEVAR